MPSKIKRVDEAFSNGLRDAVGRNSGRTGVSLPSGATHGAQSSTAQEKPLRIVPIHNSILGSCRAALVKSSAESRAMLSKFRSSIDPELAKLLEIVGDCIDEDGRTPLHIALQRGDEATAQSLIAAGANSRARDRYGATPVDLTTDENCRALLEHHIAVLAVLNDNPDALVSAVVAHCAALSAPEARRLEAVLSARAYHFDPCFLWAPAAARAALFAWVRDAFVVQLAATTPPFSDLPDDCAGDVLEFMELALPRANSQYIMEHCLSPEAHAWVCAMLTSAVAANATRRLVDAVEKGDEASVLDCLVKGADVDVQAAFGFTALVKASLSGHAAIVTLLLEAGADTDVQDDEGHTALMFASNNGNINVVKLLLFAGANTEIKVHQSQDHDDDGRTALMYPSANGNTAMVELFLSAGADVEAKNRDGYTALIFASTFGHAAIVDLLLRAGADKEAKDKLGWTALISASKNGHAAIVELLLQAGASIDAKNVDGKTAIIGASTYGHAANVNLLLHAGADKEAKDALGLTALSEASCKGHAGVVELLLQAGANMDTVCEVPLNCTSPCVLH